MGKYSPVDVQMKEHEHSYRRTLDPTDYVMLRLDGRAFHTFTKGLARPYDGMLMGTMRATTQALCENIQGVRAAYTQSDEITLLVTAWHDGSKDPLNSDLAFGGVEAKLLSLSSSIATASFNDSWSRSGGKGLAHFDSRLWTFPGNEEGRGLVVSNFNWRRADAIRNSISMAAQSQFSHKQLHKKGTKEMLQMLKEAGKDWEEEDTDFRFGMAFGRQSYSMDVQYRNKATGLVETANAIRSYWRGLPARESFTPEALSVPSPIKE